MDVERQRSRGGFVDRLERLLHPGPLDWLLKLTPEHRRFQPGAHLHGLQDHDITVRDRRATR